MSSQARAIAAPTPIPRPSSIPHCFIRTTPLQSLRVVRFIARGGMGELYEAED
jgi:hypothetical protein